LHSLFVKSDGSLWGMGDNTQGQLGDGTPITGSTISTNIPEEILVGSSVISVFDKISIQLLTGSKVQLFFMGMAGTNYALDRTFNLAPANWVPQATNPAGAGGVLAFTNAPVLTTNNFWRIRSVP
jgi:Regulator of chromosome condensation (RCC1) repeat